MKENITFQISPEEFRGIIADEVARVVRPIIEQVSQPVERDKLLTRQDTARYLGVSLPTLHEWTKTGKIVACRISTRVRYYESDVQNALRQIQAKGAFGL
jgi:excisionase family DNA binding protein